MLLPTDRDFQATGGADGAVQVHHPKFATIQTYDLGSQAIQAFIPHGQYLFVVSKSGSIYRFHIASGEVTQLYTPNEPSPQTIAVIASNTESNGSNLWLFTRKGMITRISLQCAASQTAESLSLGFCFILVCNRCINGKYACVCLETGLTRSQVSLVSSRTIDNRTALFSCASVV